MRNNPGTIAALLRDSVARLSYLPRTFRLAWAAAKGWTLAWGVLLVVQGMLPVVTVYLTRLMVDGLVAALGTHGSWESLQSILVLAALMALVVLLTEFLRSVNE